MRHIASAIATAVRAKVPIFYDVIRAIARAREGEDDDSLCGFGRHQLFHVTKFGGSQPRLFQPSGSLDDCQPGVSKFGQVWPLECRPQVRPFSSCVLLSWKVEACTLAVTNAGRGGGRIRPARGRAVNFLQPLVPLLESDVLPAL